MVEASASLPSTGPGTLRGSRSVSNVEGSAAQCLEILDLRSVILRLRSPLAFAESCRLIAERRELTAES